MTPNALLVMKDALNVLDQPPTALLATMDITLTALPAPNAHKGVQFATRLPIVLLVRTDLF